MMSELRSERNREKTHLIGKCMLAKEILILKIEGNNNVRKFKNLHEDEIHCWRIEGVDLDLWEIEIS